MPHFFISGAFFNCDFRLLERFRFLEHGGAASAWPPLVGLFYCLL